MAYQKLNLENGQVLEAEYLAHMETGIADATDAAEAAAAAGALPGGAGAYQQLVTDGEGNTGWADRLAYEESGTIKTIDPKFLPDSTPSWNDLTDRPFGEFENRVYVIEQTVVNGEWYEYSLPNIFDDEEYLTYKETVFVDVDGIQYTCKPKKKYLTGNEGYEIAFGNMELIEPDKLRGFADIDNSAPNTEPFAFIAYVRTWGITDCDLTIYTAEAHTISIYTVNTSIQAIDPKFLRTVVNLDTLTKEQVIEYAKNFKPIACRRDNWFYPALGYRLFEGTDSCDGCTPSSANVAITTPSDYELESFDITDEEYTEIATAWGMI